MTHHGRLGAFATKVLIRTAGWQCLALLASGQAATFTVKNENADGPESLLQAIVAANASGAPATIVFNIPGAGPHVIRPTAVLPDLANAISIDGFSQSGSSVNTMTGSDSAVRQVEINGFYVPAAVGLNLKSDNCTVRGLIVRGFKKAITVDHSAFGTIAGNLLTGNCGGVHLLDSPYNTIGGLSVSNRNVIFANRCGEAGYHGIFLQGAGSKFNIVAGNFIGIQPDGVTGDGNRPHGVYVLDAAQNTIGGDTTPARNLISSSSEDGVRIEGATATRNRVMGNFVGLDAAGTTARGNVHNGISVAGSANIIGGVVDPHYPFSPRNVVSGNLQMGIFVSGSGNQVQGNFIGTDAAGSSARGNGAQGMLLQGSGHLVGGTATGAGNVISGNAGNGLEISGSPLDTEGHRVEGNRIGTDATGLVALGNVGDGVRISGGAFNTIGSLEGSGYNVISGNGGNGIEIDGSEAKINDVIDNLIGADITGRAALGNRLNGILVTNAHDNTIGTGNVISGNRRHGIELAATTGNAVYQNAIGTDITLGASLGNTLDGVHLAFDATDNDIGTFNAGNFIGGNDGNGVRIEGGGNRVRGNFIGTDFRRNLLGNCYHGVSLASTASGNVIGGRTAGRGNVIAFNGGTCGVAPGDPIPKGSGVRGVGSSTNNGIYGNSIFGNTGLGIDLGAEGVTIDDPGDSDEGSNHLQNFPALDDVVSGGGLTTAHLTFSGVADTDLTIDFYANSECDPSGYGQGELYLGALTTRTDSSGFLDMGVILSVNVPGGYLVTATATDTNNNTSEFSRCAVVRFVNTPPVAKCRDITVRVTTTCDAIITADAIDPDVTDADGEPITKTLTPPPPYPAGTTVVKLTVTDPHGASDSCFFTVTVIDAGAPVITCPPSITKAADSAACTAVVTYPPATATDNCPGPIDIFCAPPSGFSFPVGTSAVTCHATDLAGNTATCTFLVKVTSDKDCPGLKIIAVDPSPSGWLAITFDSPFPAFGYRVQQSPDLGRSSWVEIPNAAVIPLNLPGLFQARFPINGGSAFYRIIALLLPQQVNVQQGEPASESVLR